MNRLVNRLDMLVTVLHNTKRPWSQIGDGGRYLQYARNLMERLKWGRVHTDPKHPNLIILCSKVPLDSRWIFDLFQDVPNRDGNFMKEYVQIKLNPPCSTLYTADELFEEIPEKIYSFTEQVPLQ